MAGQVLTSSQAGGLVLRLRGDQFEGAPRAVLRVNGVQVASLPVSSSRWQDYTVAGTWSAGTHAVSVTFVNDRSVAGLGDRNLHVDKLTFTKAAAATPTPTTSSPSTVDDPHEARIVELVNAERARAGLRALTLSTCADQYAEEWSAHMAATGNFAHRPDLGVILRACAARGVGENIAYGNVTADQMMTMWMTSPGHRANILNPQFTHIGVGATTTATGRTYGTQNFLTL